ncbi:MAG: hypothetical protein QOK02_2229, partial [Mycobacterium sp.]|nr:hypothetical protein [Mycobacterium sp.]
INHYHRPEELHPPSGDAWIPGRTADDEPVRNQPLTFDEAFGTDESVAAHDDARPVANKPLTFGEAFAPEEFAINGDNTTHQASDPDPPHDKAA